MTAPKTPATVLRPCPFCAWETPRHTAVTGRDYRHVIGYAVECPTCGARCGLAKDPPAAVTRWNLRQSQPDMFRLEDFEVKR